MHGDQLVVLPTQKWRVLQPITKSLPTRRFEMKMAQSTNQSRIGAPECLKSAQAKKPNEAIVDLFRIWMMQNERFLAIPAGRGQNPLTLRWISLI